MKRALNLLLSLAVTVLFSWYAFRDTDWRLQWDSVQAANLWWLLPYLGVLLLIHLARTLRWGALLSGLERIPFRKLNEASAIGFMLLIVLPFRLGEFARPFLIAQRSNLRRSPAMMTVVLERIVDGMFVAALLRVLLFFVPRDAPHYETVLWAGNVMFAIFAGGLGFLLFAVWQQQRAVRLIEKLAGAVSAKLAEKLAHIVGTFVGAMRQLPSRGRIVEFFVLTFAYWGLNGLGMAMLSLAFAEPIPGAELPLTLTPFQAYMVMCTLVVGVMIPSAPGMVGTFQAGVRFGLALFFPTALVATKGLAYANVLWLMQTSQQIGLGLIFMFLSNMSFRDLAGKLADEKASAAAGTDAAALQGAERAG